MSLVELQGSAEGAVFTEEQFLSMLRLARKGVTELVAAQRVAVGLPAA